MDAAARTRFLATTAIGMAEIVAGDAARGAAAIADAVALAERSGELAGDLQLLPWLALAANFLREATSDLWAVAEARYGEAIALARERDQRVRAREQLRAALGSFESLGAGPWAGRARGLPQPQERRVPPAPRLPEAWRPLP